MKIVFSVTYVVYQLITFAEGNVGVTGVVGVILTSEKVKSLAVQIVLLT